MVWFFTAYVLGIGERCTRAFSLDVAREKQHGAGRTVQEPNVHARVSDLLYKQWSVRAREITAILNPQSASAVGLLL
jgi:hypothetical protein